MKWETGYAKEPTELKLYANYNSVVCFVAKLWFFLIFLFFHCIDAGLSRVQFDASSQSDHPDHNGKILNSIGI